MFSPTDVQCLSIVVYAHFWITHACTTCIPLPIHDTTCMYMYMYILHTVRSFIIARVVMYKLCNNNIAHRDTDQPRGHYNPFEIWNLQTSYIFNHHHVQAACKNASHSHDNGDAVDLISLVTHVEMQIVGHYCYYTFSVYTP